MESLTAVVIPTRNRPEKLQRCLAALAAAREHADFTVTVADSSDDERHAAVRDVVAEHAFATLYRHDGRNVAAARNACARSTTADLLVNVDDDITVEPEAIARLVARHREERQPAAVAGAVAWDGVFSGPVKMRAIGYGRRARPDEAPDFLVGAFFAYPRALALALPWNEHIRTSDDRFMGALWRSRGVTLAYAPDARAHHDPEHVTYDVAEQRSHIYANLFDAIMANPSLGRAVSYEVLGFLAGLKRFGRERRDLARFVHAWIDGHRALARDRRDLRALLERPLP